MKHKDPICCRIIDDDTRFVTFADARTFFFCSENCKHEFDESRRLYLVKRIDHDQRKIYKTRPCCKPAYKRA
ncbi:MAG: hypothetical protein GYA24_07755 [Candidatus Lokiarchaeota archaeon]|nr:hypothetical protein [Candidatus Lokiarchaeota archaeon]